MSISPYTNKIEVHLDADQIQPTASDFYVTRV